MNAYVGLYDGIAYWLKTRQEVRPAGCIEEH